MNVSPSVVLLVWTLIHGHCRVESEGHELATVGDSILRVYYPVAPSWSFQPRANVYLNSTLDQRMLDSLLNESHSLMLDSVSYWTQHEEINTAAPIDSEVHCLAENTTVTYPGLDSNCDITISWPKTPIGQTMTVDCPCEFKFSSTALKANRTCSGDSTIGAKWMEPNNDPCNFSMTARRLCQLARLNTSYEVAEVLDNITRETGSIGFTEVTITVSILDKILPDALEDSELAVRYISVVDNLLSVRMADLQMSQDMSNSSGRLNAGLKDILRSYIMTGESVKYIYRQHFNITLRDIDSTAFRATKLSSDNISLPSTLLDYCTSTVTSRRVAQSVFDNPGLYLSRNIGTRHIASKVFDFSVFDCTTDHFPDPLNLTLSQTVASGVDRSTVHKILCAFWDQSLDDGYGNWSTRGCTRMISSSNSSPDIICQCNHLTSFAILLDVSPRSPERAAGLALQIYSIFAAVISILCLIVAIVTYLVSARLRRNVTHRLLLSLNIAFVCLYTVFIIATWGDRLTLGVCYAVGALVHYFLLVVFFGIAALAIDVFMKVVMVFRPRFPFYSLKVLLVSWVTPVLLVLFCLAPDYGSYATSYYCGPSRVPFYVGVIIPFVILYIFNTAIFVSIMVSVFRKYREQNRRQFYRKSGSTKTFVINYIRIIITCIVYFGFGWIIGPAGTQALPLGARILFEIAFISIFGFHGLFLFLLMVVFNGQARNEWKAWIRCKRFDPTTIKHRYEGTTVSTHTRGGRVTRRTSSTINRFDISTKTSMSVVSAMVPEEYYPTEMDQQSITELKTMLEGLYKPTSTSDPIPIQNEDSMVTGMDIIL